MPNVTESVKSDKILMLRELFFLHYQGKYSLAIWQSPRFTQPVYCNNRLWKLLSGCWFQLSPCLWPCISVLNSASTSSRTLLDTTVINSSSLLVLPPNCKPTSTMFQCFPFSGFIISFRSSVNLTILLRPSAFIMKTHVPSSVVTGWSLTIFPINPYHSNMILMLYQHTSFWVGERCL